MSQFTPPFGALGGPDMTPKLPSGPELPQLSPFPGENPQPGIGIPQGFPAGAAAGIGALIGAGLHGDIENRLNLPFSGGAPAPAPAPNAPPSGNPGGGGTAGTGAGNQAVPGPRNTGAMGKDKPAPSPAEVGRPRTGTPPNSDGAVAQPSNLPPPTGKPFGQSKDTPSPGNPSLPPGQPVPTPPTPFTGGQQPGVLYRVTYNATWFASSNPAQPQSVQNGIMITVTGAIVGYRSTSPGPDGSYQIELVHTSGNGFTALVGGIRPTAAVTNIRRLDGLPDQPPTFPVPSPATGPGSWVYTGAGDSTMPRSQPANSANPATAVSVGTPAATRAGNPAATRGIPAGVNSPAANPPATGLPPIPASPPIPSPSSPPPNPDGSPQNPTSPSSGTPGQPLGNPTGNPSPIGNPSGNPSTQPPPQAYNPPLENPQPEATGERETECECANQEIQRRVGTELVQVPIVSCEINPETSKREAVTTQRLIQVLTWDGGSMREATLATFQQLADIETKLCMDEAVTSQAILSVPEQWAIFPEYHRPQAMVIWMEKENGKFKGGPYSTVIPFYNRGSDYRPPFKPRVSGNIQGTLRLTDGSHVIVYANTIAEAKRVMGEIQPLISKGKLAGGTTKYAEINANRKSKTLHPYAIQYFPEGVKTQMQWELKYKA